MRPTSILPTYLILAMMTLLSACGDQAKDLTLQGSTMGTTWSVKLAGPTKNGPKALQQAIEARLVSINQQMSTYDPQSAISKFNQSRSTDWQLVPAELVTVVSAAQQLAKLSDGQFDPTVGPLVNLWGFGPDHRPDEIPSAAAITSAKAVIGYNKLQVQREPPALQKLNPELYIDLSAIAKGYGVDEIGKVVEQHGVTNYLAEIGGELRGRGKNPRGTPWRIGIEKPVAGERIASNIIDLDGKAVATSGDYRNYFEQNGRRFSHTIDPNTGRPITHKLASVSVVHSSTMMADGWATTLMVLGPERGLALANQQKLAVLMLIKDGDGFTESRSQLMQLGTLTP